MQISCNHKCFGILADSWQSFWIYFACLIQSKYCVTEWNQQYQCVWNQAVCFDVLWCTNAVLGQTMCRSGQRSCSQKCSQWLSDMINEHWFLTKTTKTAPTANHVAFYRPDLKNLLSRQPANQSLHRVTSYSGTSWWKKTERVSSLKKKKKGVLGWFLACCYVDPSVFQLVARW